MSTQEYKEKKRIKKKNEDKSFYFLLQGTFVQLGFHENAVKNLSSFCDYYSHAFGACAFPQRKS